jgi:hypothetical protein
MLLQVKAINSITKRLYTEGDQYHIDNRVPEVGSNATFEDGRCFVFCSTDVDLTPGQAVGQVAAAAELTDITAAVAAGATEVRFVKASVTADQYKGGYLSVTLGSGIGYTYKIKDNTASATVDTVADTVIVNLEEEVAVAMAATDNIIIKAARTSKVIVNTATTDPVGITQVATTAATLGKTQYFWAQTNGPSVVLGTAGAAGVALDCGAAGALAAGDGANVIVATGMAAGASNSMANLCFPKA